MLFLCLLALFSCNGAFAPGVGADEGFAVSPPEDSDATDVDPDIPTGPDDCRPPHTVWEDGRCRSSCGHAGGNWCTGQSDPVCRDREQFDSYDCEVCCDRHS